MTVENADALDPFVNMVLIRSKTWPSPDTVNISSALFAFLRLLSLSTANQQNPLSSVVKCMSVNRCTRAKNVRNFAHFYSCLPLLLLFTVTRESKMRDNQPDK